MFVLDYMVYYVTAIDLNTDVYEICIQYTSFDVIK